MDKRFVKSKALYRSPFLQNEVPVDDVPVGNLEKVNTLFANHEPYEFVNQVLLGENHKASEGWSEVVLTQAWAKTFADAVNQHPGPVYLQGHEDAQNPAMREIPAGYIVGAKVDETYENGAGRLLLRNRLFAHGKYSKEIVEQTLREINAGVLNTSTGDYERREYVYNEEEDTITAFAIESVKNQTNAIVERDMNASDAMILASNFKYVFCDENGKEIGKPVDYTSIRSDFNMNQGDEGMKKEELLNALKGMFKDGTVTSDELSETLGVKLMNDEVSTSVAMFKEVKGMLGDTDVKEFVKTALKQKEDAKKEAFAKLRDDALQASFIVANELRLAKHMFKLTDGDKEAVDAEIKRIQEDPDMQEEHKTALKNMNYTPSGFVGDSQDNEPAQNGMMEA
jgi:hypothetical protein